MCLGAAPQIVRSAVGAHGHRRVEQYRLNLWCLHRYQYPPRLAVDDEERLVKPGEFTLIPPRRRLRFQFPGPSCQHHYALFRMATTGESQPMRLHHQLSPARSRELEQQFQRVVDGGGGSRSTAALWELLWRLADDVEERSPEEQVAQRIEEGLGLPLTVAELAESVGLSADHLTRRFRARYGMTVIAWIREQRLQLARRLLLEGMSPAEVATACGIPDLQYFNKQVRARWGCSPRTLQRG